MVIRKLLRELSACLEENGEFEARELFMHVTGMSLTEVTLGKDRDVSAADEERVRALVKRRQSGEPLQYITGTAEFMGLEFKVNQYTLIPRQDTETLVMEVLPLIKQGARVLDIGCGSGCIGISIARFAPISRVTLVDISEKALEAAGANARKNGVDAELKRLDILRELPEGTYDVIVSNPPYIRTDVIDRLDAVVKDHEPRTALDGGADGLVFYRRITEKAYDMLSDNGVLAFEIGYDQGEDVKGIVKEKFGSARVIKDYCGNDRVVIAERKNV